VTIAALLVAACSAGAPPGSAVASIEPSGSAAVAPANPSVSLEPSPSAEPASPEPSTDGVDGAAGPGCGTGRLGLLGHRREVPDMLHFGGATIEFATAGIAMRNGSYGADDVIPAGLGLTPNEIAVKVAPSTRILLRGDGLTFVSSTVRVVPWSTVSFTGGMGASPQRGTELPTRVRSDGSISVSAPLAAGDYMVEFGPRWQSECLQGDGSAYSRIKVVAP
jgi:hypothetical protein